MSEKMSEEEIYDYAFSHFYSSVEGNLAMLPFSIPVVLDNEEIGNIKIDFEYKKGKKTHKDEEVDLDFLSTFFTFLEELNEINALLKKDIDLMVKIKARYQEKIKRYSDLRSFFGLLPEVNYRDFWYKKEEELFELVKLEGPITLRNSIVYEKINNWLSDRKFAGVKINKLGKSLLEYAFRPSLEKVPCKLGRPRKPLLYTFNAKGVINRYNAISAMLKIVKKNKKSYKGNIHESIRKAEKEFLFSRKDDPEWQSRYERSIEEKEYEFFKLIWSCIEEDSSLKEYFGCFLWEPNNLAKKVLARLLDVSESTLDNYMSSQE